MTKTIDFSKTVYQLCNENPEIIEILAKLGFTDITKPGMLNTVGRFMTIEKGSKAKNIDMEIIKQTFKNHNYEIKGDL